MTAKKRRRIYWDSSVFLAWLKPEPERKRACDDVLATAKTGESIIITSAIALTEVIKLKGKPAIPETEEAKIKGFFKRSYISVVVVDRFLAESARTLIWRHGLKPKDALHVATATRLQVDELHSFDDDMLKLSGKFGRPLILICKPSTEQGILLRPADEALPSEETLPPEQLPDVNPKR